MYQSMSTLASPGISGSSHSVCVPGPPVPYGTAPRWICRVRRHRVPPRRLRTLCRPTYIDFDDETPTTVRDATHRAGVIAKSTKLLDMAGFLDIAPLRSLVAVADCGGFQRAGDPPPPEPGARSASTYAGSRPRSVGRWSSGTAAGRASPATASSCSSTPAGSWPLHDETLRSFERGAPAGRTPSAAPSTRPPSCSPRCPRPSRPPAPGLRVPLPDRPRAPAARGPGGRRSRPRAAARRRRPARDAGRRARPDLVLRPDVVACRRRPLPCRSSPSTSPCALRTPRPRDALVARHPGGDRRRGHAARRRAGRRRRRPRRRADGHARPDARRPGRRAPTCPPPSRCASTCARAAVSPRTWRT